MPPSLSALPCARGSYPFVFVWNMFLFMSMPFMTLSRNSDPLSVWNITTSCSPTRAFSSAMIEGLFSVSSAQLVVRLCEWRVL
eukprot:7006970-Lingulodinium_polyedra.AAC.1